MSPTRDSYVYIIHYVIRLCCCREKRMRESEMSDDQFLPIIFAYIMLNTIVRRNGLITLETH